MGEEKGEVVSILRVKASHSLLNSDYKSTHKTNKKKTM